MADLSETMTEQQNPVEPTVAERREAKKWPNGFLYRIDPACDPNGRVPPEGIQGAWPVDAHGSIVGEFRPNPNYRPSSRQR